jgi:hypothetical protein
MRVISSPSSSTTGLATLILAMYASVFGVVNMRYHTYPSEYESGYSKAGHAAQIFAQASFV